MLNDMETLLLKARGYGEPLFTTTASGDVVASASKRVGKTFVRAAHLGRSQQDAARRLVALVARP